MAKTRFNEPRIRESVIPSTRGQRAGRAEGRDNAPIVNLKSAMTNAPRATARQNPCTLLEAGEDAGGVFVVVKTYLHEPEVSQTGKSFGVAWGVVDSGSLKVATNCYIPIPAEDRYRYAHLAEAARAAKAARGNRRGADDAEDDR